MSKHKNLKRNLLICLLAGSAVMYTLPLHAATSVVANNALPQNGQFFNGNEFIQGKANEKGNGFDFADIGSITKPNDLTMNVHQNEQNAVIKWDSFDVGGSATVNFTSDKSNFNTLNYVNSGAASQIYGTINGLGGNIYVVNTAGVQIGPSAQINVGSLHVSSNTLDDNALTNFYNNANNDGFVLGGTSNADIELMSLGNINANKVTFEGDGRIVIDSERIKDANGAEKLNYQNINITTAENNTGNIIIGYDAYDENNGYKVVNPDGSGNKIANVTTESGTTSFTKADGYMWVEDVEQLQDIDTNLSGNYALRNSIDATSTEQNDFTSIGSADNAFEGKFDGIEYNIFGLNITGNDNAGLFGYTDGATINNVTLVGGSISGGTNVGAVVGSATNTTISNVISSAAVTGNSNVGGIVGSATGTTVENAINTGAVSGSANNVGGLIGIMTNNVDAIKSQLIGNSYNLGNVEGVGHNVGGLVGRAVNSTIGDGTNLVYNRLDVTGAYNVGGIVGKMEGSTVQNAENSATVTATGFDEGTYTYHTANVADGSKTEDVYIANVGGIAGTATKTDTNKSKIENVTNSGDVATVTKDGQDSEQNKVTYYIAGNVGGIVGSAVDTNITNATNQENDVRGAHNVGGVAGYFGGNGTVDKGINSGGEIMATGARNESGFVTETVRPTSDGSNETFIIGNIGGVVGYMDGDDVNVTGSANRGTVHTYDIDAAHADNVLDISKAANVGGVVGKIDRNDDPETITEGTIKNAAVSNSYNTGDVRGYTGVGGVVGMMYNGEVAGSYNLGYISTTRQSTTGGSIDALNMGGIVGDTTEHTNAEVYLYDVYNKGQIGDENFDYFGRHVGGIVGRLSGTVEKAYNNGAIYNGYNVVGGIAGWMVVGEISNAFNTGNITVVNKNNAESQVGGIVGAASDSNGITIENAYNLGTLRSFKDTTVTNVGANTLGGIIGQIQNENSGDESINISNVYTTGNLYIDNTDGGIIGSIYGNNTIGNRLTVENTYYIKPQDGLDFQNLYNANDPDNDKDNSNKAINYADRSDSNNYGGLNFTSQIGGAVTGNGDWRIYGDTPILNTFLPDSEQYFDQYDTTEKLKGAGMASVQYGTAYDPLLTIITANEGKDNLTFNFGTGPDELSITNAAGLVVYNAGLTLNNFDTNSGAGYFGGTIYADGTLNIKGNNDIGFGSASQIYGSSVNIKADGTVTIYGDVTATGNDTNINDNPDEAGSIKITSTGGDVDIYGTLTSAKSGQSVTIPGIAGTADPNWSPVETDNSINDPSAELNTTGDRFAYTTESSNVNGNIIISAGATDDDGKVTATGNVNLYYGNKENGLITTGGNLTVEATGDVYVDSDLDIGGKLSLTAGADKEIVLDITNIGQVQTNHNQTESVNKLHDFLDKFSSDTNAIEFGGTDDAKITVDMWTDDNFDLDKFDENNATLAETLQKVHVNVNGNTQSSAKNITYIWVSSADQLNNIQAYKNDNDDSNILSYNFALKNDINASDVTNYNVIGGNDSYNGTFDGRGNRIIGLNVTADNAGIFSSIGETGIVKNLNIYSSNFKSISTNGNAGAIAGVNNGRIENITTFGNTVSVAGENGNAGGIVGVNNGKGTFNADTSGEGASTLTGNGIYDVESTDSVIAGNAVVAGGLVGTNNGALGNSYSNSAVTANDGTGKGLGGVVGVNNQGGEVQYVDSLGVTNGGSHLSNNVGGVIGINSGKLNSAYNESIVSGFNNVGGIVGDNSGSLENIVNATSVTGMDYNNGNIYQNSLNVGGLVGSNSGSVTNGRNNGTITGTNYVGGMVGNNAEHAQLTDLVNDSSASITGVEYVGGIAGSNAGTITADEDNDNLVNRGDITGYKYVGGVAGVNTSTGIIANTNNSVVLNANEDVEGTAKYFGGVVGQNSGLIDGATNTSDIDITAVGGSYVGGIIGQNTETGRLEGEILNQGSVAGKSNVGGIIGENNNAQLLNNGDNNERLQITNTGSVSATEGGAAGIFYNNNIQGDTNANAINNADITNSGTVTGGTAFDSVTGGLFGYNSGNITNSTLTNTGIVTGGGIVGGLIGINTGNIEDSSLKNLADITVNGNVKDVGGLIGKNTGTITGGRTEADGTDAGYYKYQIYNNGTITVNGSGSNIGGLIGKNDVGGTLTAGYNTGAINAAGSTNVGGIAGSNSGTIDQVFNTVMTADGTNETITGGTNVGGLVGNNSGDLSNAYNTTAVSGNTENAVIGNAVGTNSGTISNIYATNTTGNLIGAGYENNVSGTYSFSANDTSATTVLSADEQENSDSYGGFDFTGSEDKSAVWKNYDGSGNPLLKVFLTKVTVDADNLPELVYNTQDQDLNIDNLTGENGAFSAVDDFAAYNNNKDLIQNTDFEHKNAGTYDDWLYSQQIAASNGEDGFNPNNLGYDIELTTSIDKAQITISLDEINRVYGNEAINNVVTGGHSYGYTFDTSNVGMNNDLKAEIEDALSFTQKSDGAVDGVTGNKVTNDVKEGGYTWSAEFTLKSNNFEFSTNNADKSKLTIDNGISKVIKADLTITADDKVTMPGVMPEFTGTVDGLTNGDTLDYVFGLSSNNNGIINVDGNYSDVIGIVIDGHFYELGANWATGLFANYDVKYEMGNLTVSSELLPDLPDNWPSNRWDYLFSDNPFDRNRNFRERKAEVNFVDGGMEI